jgi:hypothetical protein
MQKLYKYGARGQPGFFDLEDCYAQLSGNGDPLEALEEAVPWEAFRARLSVLADMLFTGLIIP